MAQYEITTEPIELDFECTAAKDAVERTIWNAKNLLMCRKGEIPFDRNRGLDQSLFDLPFGEANQRITEELDRVMMDEPDVEVVEGWLDVNEDGDTVVHCILTVTFEEDEE